MAESLDERIGWAFGLISESPQVRAEALRRLHETREDHYVALRAYNEVIMRRGGRERPEYPERLETYKRSSALTFPHALWRRRTVSMAHWEGLPYAVLLLEWEARHPVEWSALNASLGSKKHYLRELAQDAHQLPPPVVRQLEDLVMLAAERQYRCEDSGYARLARAIDTPRLRASLAIAARSDVEPRRTHAAYLLWLIRNPALPHPKIRQWKTWLLQRSIAAARLDEGL